MKHTIRSVDELKTFAKDFLLKLPSKESATVVALSGGLGAGKTTFAQCVASALGVADTVSSPTFVLEKIYSLSGKEFSHLIHMDAYRIKSAHELRVLGWEEIVREKGNLILIEWPERVQDLIPKDALMLTFDIDGDTRIITDNVG